MKKKKLLLHICCAPCSVYIFEKLRRFYEVTGFFYNPNIQPKREYDFREEELKKISIRNNWKVIFADYDMKTWFNKVKGYETEPERGNRCLMCFDIRLRKTFELAKKLKFEVVTSTLSISPYKNTKQINRVGVILSQEYSIDFLPENFKKMNGYAIGKKIALEQGIKHQDYCGCVYSKVEKLLRIRLKR